MKSLFLIIIAAALSSCGEGPKEQSNGSTTIYDGGHGFAIYIVTKEGRDFAVAVSDHGGISICPATKQ